MNIDAAVEQSRARDVDSHFGDQESYAELWAVNRYWEILQDAEEHDIDVLAFEERNLLAFIELMETDVAEAGERLRAAIRKLIQKQAKEEAEELSDDELRGAA